VSRQGAGLRHNCSFIVRTVEWPNPTVDRSGECSIDPDDTRPSGGSRTHHGCLLHTWTATVNREMAAIPHVVQYLANQCESLSKRHASDHQRNRRQNVRLDENDSGGSACSTTSTDCSPECLDPSVPVGTFSLIRNGHPVVERSKALLSDVTLPPAMSCLTVGVAWWPASACVARRTTAGMHSSVLAQKFGSQTTMIFSHTASSVTIARVLAKRTT
jgi:hypothetical protein